MDRLKTDWLNKAARHVVESIRSMTHTARLLSAVLLVGLITSGVYLCRNQSDGGTEYLFGGREFSQSDLASMETAFAKAGLIGSEIVGNQIRVPHAQKFAYLAALADSNALPEEFLAHTTQATQQASIFESHRQREARLKTATQKDLALIVSRMSGIRAATVQFSEVSTGGLSRSTEKSALVAVQAIGNASLDAEHVQAIRNTVAAAIGVQQQNVTVTDLNARHAYVGTSAAAAGNDSNYLTDKAQFEKQWQDKIYRRLAIYPGIVVGVNVELDADAHRFNKTVTAYRAALAPTRVTASIDVPASYFLDVWRTRNAESQSNHGEAPSRAELHSIEAEVKANIEAAVVGMLPPWPVGAEPFRRVTVTAYQDLPSPLEQGPSWARGASRWMAANWQLLGMAMLGAISLLLLPSVIRAAKSPPAKASTPSTDAAATGNDESPKEPPAATSKEPQHHVETSDQTLHEELQKRVRQDPQAAAKVLRHWIGDAA